MIRMACSALDAQGATFVEIPKGVVPVFVSILDDLCGKQGKSCRKPTSL
jgi:hypothetical protein